MDVDDDDACGELIGEGGEEDEDDGDAVVQKKLVVFAVRLAYEDCQLDQREEVHSHLCHEVLLHNQGHLLVTWPPWEIFADALAFSLPANHAWEPWLPVKQIVSPDSYSGVEEEVEAELFERL